MRTKLALKTQQVVLEIEKEVTRAELAPLSA